MVRHATIQDIIKSRSLVSVSPWTTVALASRIMRDRKVDAIAVVENGTFLGLVTEQAVCRRAVAGGLDVNSATVISVMMACRQTLSPCQSVIEGSNLMLQLGLRHMPVLDNKMIVGIVSSMDIYFSVKQSLETNVRQLDDFLFGSGYSMPLAA